MSTYVPVSFCDWSFLLSAEQYAMALRCYYKLYDEAGELLQRNEDFLRLEEVDATTDIRSLLERVY